MPVGSQIAEVNVVSSKDILFDDKTKIKCKCSFCGKESILYNETRTQHYLLSNNGKFYCGFCLKNNFNNKSSKNTLILSFRGIIAFYYYFLYRAPVGDPVLYHNDIKDYIALHVKIGNKNPVFLYDQESYCWFIDFNKIGNGNRKIKLKYVLHTVIEILASFNLYRYYPEFDGAELYKKYQESILEFYKHRSRPVGKPILIPTLLKCGINETRLASIDTKMFIPEMFQIVEKYKS